MNYYIRGKTQPLSYEQRIKRKGIMRNVRASE